MSMKWKVPQRALLATASIALFAALTLGRAHAQESAAAPANPNAQAEMVVADPAELAFEEARWEDAITEYREILAAYPADRLSLLRIAQAQRELKRHNEALATLEQARTANAPEAMIDLERARNYALLGDKDNAMAALDAADHSGLRAFTLIEQATEFNAFRTESRFQRVYRNVRARVFPCEGEERASDFDFWLGRWEVRLPDGTLVGHNNITKGKGGCSIEEHWEGAGGTYGTSTSFYLPSRGQWRQVWAGSGGTLFDITGELVDGVMKMEGTIEYVELKNVVAFRGAWSHSDDGRVRTRLEEFDLAAQTWVVWFDGFYKRLD
jgi:hypothetical protein